MAYNGWSNRATWNVALWLNNDEPLYREMRSIVKANENQGSSHVARALELLCDELWPSGTTPDGDSLTAVDWQEIAAAELES